MMLDIERHPHNTYTIYSFHIPDTDLEECPASIVEHIKSQDIRLIAAGLAALDAWQVRQTQ